MRGIISEKLTSFLDQVNIALAEAKAKQEPLSVKQVRINLDKLADFISTGPVLTYVKDTFFQLPNRKIAVRLYSSSPQKKLPLVIHFHGGGHMCGSIDLYDDISRKVALAGNCIVLAVEYRLAPEYPYPAGIDDCQYALGHYQELLHELEHNGQVYILGDSAGGAICTTLAQRSLSDKTLKIDKQILIYPSVDYTLSSDSIKSNGSGYLLESNKVEWYFEQYFQQYQEREKVSPLYGDITSELPKTLIITAGCDPLRDEGLAYAGALISAGVAVQHQHFDNLIHAFMLLESLVSDECQQTYQLIGDFIRA